MAHLSGAVGLEALDPAREAGAHRLAIHPLQTFPDVVRAIDLIPGSTFARHRRRRTRATRVAERIADDVMGEPFRLEDGTAARCITPPPCSRRTTWSSSRTSRPELFAEAGVPDPVRAMAQLQRATPRQRATTWGRSGRSRAPRCAGDGGTVERNLRALAAHAPRAVAGLRGAGAAWRSTSRVGSGRLDDAGRRAVEEVLARWS